MQRGDNLYSMNDDSDSEEQHELSPTDGYFQGPSSHVTPRVPNVSVFDPTIEQRSELERTPKGKEEEEEERRTSSERHPDNRPSGSSAPEVHRQAPASAFTSPLAQRTHSQSSASQTPFHTYPARARSSSLYSEAPPAYTPSHTCPISSLVNSSQQEQSSNYSTFINSNSPSHSPSHSHSRDNSSANITMGVPPPTESDRLLMPQPQSMGPPGDEESGDTSWARRTRRWLPAWLGWKTALLALIIFIAVVVALTKRGSSHGNDSTIRPDPNGRTGPPPFESTHCSGKQYGFHGQELVLEFDRAQNVSFSETLHKHSGPTSVHVGGQVHVRKLTKGTGQPRIVLEAATNDPNLKLEIVLDSFTQLIKVSVPDKHDYLSTGDQPCVTMRATIWVPEDAEIGTLSVDVVHLAIILFDDLSIHVADSTKLSSISGNIDSGSLEAASNQNDFTVSSDSDFRFIPNSDEYVLDSRIIEVSTISSKISGNWPLYDSLTLGSKSGDIRVSITPKDELTSKPEAPMLSVKTVSGAVQLAEPINNPKQIPLRNYIVYLQSVSGAINTNLAFSSEMIVRSTSDAISLDLLPVLNVDEFSPDSPAKLRTSTTSGTTTVNIREALWFDASGKSLLDTIITPVLGEGIMPSKSKAKKLNCVDSFHKSASGNVGFRYPQSWVGYLTADSISGHLTARGKDLEIVKYPGGWLGSSMEARKGPKEKGSNVQVHTVSGGMDATFGDEW
ncbi:hypothetical protein GGR57DRAFT_304142 [Xylariaceae sp. FL1272]|nr:hypothetical protein GGR57DRAFT_304142 [Xylariaceae sp. FL1272]